MTAAGLAAPADSAWSVYVLRCADATLYVGSTTDLVRRVRQHQDGLGAAYTRGRRPVRVLYVEAQPDRASAQRREAALKRLTRADKLRLCRRARGGRASGAASGSRTGPASNGTRDRDAAD